MRYVFNLTDGKGALNYDSHVCDAANLEEALKKAAPWVNNMKSEWPDAWLRVSAEGQTTTFPPGNF